MKLRIEVEYERCEPYVLQEVESALDTLRGYGHINYAVLSGMPTTVVIEGSLPENEHESLDH